MNSTEVLPFLRVRQDVTLSRDIRIVRRVPVDEDFGWTFIHAFEIRRYFGRDGFDKPQAILEVDGGDVEEIAAHCCAIDLALGRWSYILRKHQALSQAHVGHAFPKPVLYHLTPARTQLLSVVLPRLRRGTVKCRRRLQLSLRRWHAALNTAVGIQSVMHGLAALEGLLLQGTGDMRLRLAIRAAAVVGPGHRREVFAQIYRNYKRRNEVAHGSDIPELSPSDQLDFIKATTRVMSVALSHGLPDPASLDARVLPWIGLGDDGSDG